jgi:hypothetical protein
LNSTNPISVLERQVLNHVARFKLTTRETCGKTGDLREQVPGDLDNSISRLKREGYLISGALFGKQNYFALTEKGMANVTIPIKRKHHYGLLSEIAKYKSVGVLDYCLDPRTSWLPAIGDELRELIGDSIVGLPGGFLRDSKNNRYCFLRVDLSIESAPNRSAQAIRTDLLTIRRHPKLFAAFQDRSLEYAWTTATKPRSDKVIERFRKYHDVGHDIVKFHVAPILLPLAVSIPLATSLDKRVTP